MLPVPAPRLSHSRPRARLSRAGLFLFALVVLPTLAGCHSNLPRNHWWQFWRPKATEASKVYNPDTVVLPPPPDVADPNGNGSAMGREGQPPAPGSVAEPGSIRQQAHQASELHTVYFQYDSAELTPDAIATLDQDAQWLQQNAGIDIQIEGHTDERGTAEYNLNLGNRRAMAVKEYLMSKGVGGDHLHTISYGAERPLQTGHGEQMWSKNRRVQFLSY